MTEAKQKYLSWLEATGSPLSQQLFKLKEEFEEVQEPLFGMGLDRMNALKDNEPELAEHIAREATDLAIVSIAVIHLLGRDFDSLYTETVEKIERKYPTERIKEMRAMGLAIHAVFALLKDEWNQREQLTENPPIVDPQDNQKSRFSTSGESGFSSGRLQPVTSLEPSKY